MSRKFPIYLLLGTFMASFLFSCVGENEKGVEVLSNSVVLKEFSLQENEYVLENLDTVFFTIDLNKGLVYNVDSLPMGTDVSGLKVNMVYATSASAEFHVTGGKWMKDTVFTYNTEDSIDFTGDVKFTIVSNDMSCTKTYTLKVNVHQIEPDTLYWSEMARRTLPSFTTPIEQKTVNFDNSLYCFLRDTKGYIMSVTQDPSHKWEKERIELPFTPLLNTFTATENAMYILDENKDLYTSTNGKNWTACGVKMYNLLGNYGDLLLGLTEEDGKYKFAEYPVSEGFVATQVPADFPIKGASQMVKLDSEWAVSPQMIMVGGEKANGDFVGDVWGYDGNSWNIVSRMGMIPATGYTLFPYYCTYLDTESLKSITTKVLLAVGGWDKDIFIDREMYMSEDNGLTWILATECLQLPEYIESFTSAQAFVWNTTYYAESRSYSDEWVEMQTKLPACMRVKSRTTEPITSWDVPYVYIVGGHNIHGQLYDNIWRGVINRLTFKPVI